MRRDLLNPKVDKILDLKEKLQADLEQYMKYLSDMEGIWWDGDSFVNEEDNRMISNDLTVPAERAIDHLSNHWEVEIPSNIHTFY